MDKEADKSADRGKWIAERMMQIMEKWKQADIDDRRMPDIYEDVHEIIREVTAKEERENQ